MVSQSLVILLLKSEKGSDECVNELVEEMQQGIVNLKPEQRTA
jgi:hypothetical protein